MVRRDKASASLASLLPHFGVGILFGIVAVQSEIISWYRIQEMFRFQSFHMYGVIGSAVFVAGVSLWLIKRLGLRSFNDELISVPAKVMGRGYRYWIGGTFFGLGWGLTGACPGPIYALIGAGYPVMLLVLVSALAGTRVYAQLQERLWH